MTSQAWSILTTRVSERLSGSRSSTVVNPTRPPAVKTGPPALPRAALRSDRSRRGPTPVTSPGVRSFSPLMSAPMAYSSCPFATEGLVWPHPSGSGRSDAITDGLTQRMATSRVGSNATTVAFTLMS